MKNEELSSIQQADGGSKQWYNRIDLSGNLALGTYYARYIHHSTSDFTMNSAQMDGHVYADGNLFIDANIWDDLDVHFQWFITGGMSPFFFNATSSTPISLGEVYLHWKNIIRIPILGDIGLKAGTFDLPFGEEYLTQYRVDNPFILNSAAWPWAQDQGILFSGKVQDNGWIFSITDGSFSSAADEHPSKAYNLKIYGKPWAKLYLSGSFMKSGGYVTPALWLGNNTFPKKAVGTSGVKGFDAGEIDFTFSIVDWLDFSANYGMLQLEDGVTPGLDRTLHWYMVQPKAWISENIYLLSRYSVFGANLAYNRMFAEPVVKSSTTAGLPYKEFMQYRQRFELGAGYQANPNTLIKLEFARDYFKVAGGTLDPSRDHIDFVGTEVVVKF